jgi:prevent-host-death family protein
MRGVRACGEYRVRDRPRRETCFGVCAVPGPSGVDRSHAGPGCASRTPSSAEANSLSSEEQQSLGVQLAHTLLVPSISADEERGRFRNSWRSSVLVAAYSWCILSCLSRNVRERVLVWQLQAAKQHFSELVDRARRDGPQVVTKHGKDAVVVVSVEEYQRLRGNGPSLVEFIRSAPDFGLLDLDRSGDRGRDVEL